MNSRPLPERPKPDPAWLDDPDLSVTIASYRESIKFMAAQRRAEQPKAKPKLEPSEKAGLF